MKFYAVMNGVNWDGFCRKAGTLVLALWCWIWAGAQAPSVIILQSCGVSYVDPQDQNNQTTSQTRDTLLYRSIFQDSAQLREFYVDINAFGGQQTDRARVFAIMPDQSLKPLGAIAFGNCTDCVQGFALVDNDSLLVQGVSDRNTMSMWLQGLNQPPFALSGNLQALTGVGRISGRIPFCAIGFQVEFIVNSNPNNASTEFSTHIICPRPLAACTIEKEARIDCGKDSIFLRAGIPVADCFAGNVRARWRHANGWQSSGPEASLPLEPGNLGWFYLQVEDDDCVFQDSVFLENPSFAAAGEDTLVCRGSSLRRNGAGGQNPFWILPSQERSEGFLLELSSVTPLDQGWYVLHSFNEAGCEDTDSLRLEVRIPPNPDIQVGGACLGDTLRLLLGNAADFRQIEWFDPQGQPLSQPELPNFETTDAGRYSLRAVDSLGCTVESEFDVQAASPPAFEVQIEEACDSTRVFLLPAEYQYVWQNGQQGDTLATVAGGLWSVTITDTLGCATVATIDVPQPEGPEFDVGLEHPFCPGDPGVIEVELTDSDRPVIFSIDGGVTYSLSGRFEDLDPGSYRLVVQDELGCIQERLVTIEAADTIGVSLDYSFLDVRPLTPIALTARTVGAVREYQWIPEEINTGGAGTSFIATRDLDVRIVVRDARGCHASAGFPLSIVLGEVFVPNAFSPDDDGVNDRFTFFSDLGSGEIIESLEIFDRWGTRLFAAYEFPLNDESRGWDGRFEGRPVGAGVLAYYGVVRFGNGVRKIYKGDVALMR